MQETQETQIRSLDGEDSLEEGLPTHSGLLAKRIPWTEEPGGLPFTESESQTHLEQPSTWHTGMYHQLETSLL